VVLQHYIWFDYFGKHIVSSNINLTLMSLIGFFMVFIWLLPAGFFISLTFADETLPTRLHQEWESSIRQVRKGVVTFFTKKKRNKLGDTIIKPSWIAATPTERL